LANSSKVIRAARPTAVNFSWGDDRVLRVLDKVSDSGDTGEIRRMGERQLAPADVKVYNLAFDATPLDLVTAIITEWGIYRPPEMPDLG